MGSMEGKEVRFGIAQSAMFTTTTTSFTTGTVNNMHDTLTPLGGMIPMLHMMLNVVFGGKGVGLMNMIMYAILAVFICGLMIGRTPEYLGKKIEGREMKLAALCIIIHPLLILAFSALAVAVPAGTEGITNPGFHGLQMCIRDSIDFTHDCFAGTDKIYTVEIVANGYEKQTLEIKNNGLVDGDTHTESEENKNIPSVKSLVFKSEILNSYYRLSFNLSVEEASAYLNAITSIEVDGNNCKQVSNFWNEKSSYKFRCV